MFSRASISFLGMSITYFITTNVCISRLGIALMISSACASSRAYSAHFSLYISSISLIVAKLPSRPAGAPCPPGMPVIFCVMFHSRSCAHCRRCSVLQTSCIVYSTARSRRMSLFTIFVGPAASRFPLWLMFSSVIVQFASGQRSRKTCCSASRSILSRSRSPRNSCPNHMPQYGCSRSQGMDQISAFRAVHIA